MTETEIKQRLDGTFVRFHPINNCFVEQVVPLGFTGNYQPAIVPESTKRKYKRTGEKLGSQRIEWDAVMDQELLRLRAARVPLVIIADKIGVSKSAIDRRLEALRDVGKI